MCSNRNNGSVFIVVVMVLLLLLLLLLLSLVVVHIVIYLAVSVDAGDMWNDGVEFVGMVAQVVLLPSGDFDGVGNCGFACAVTDDEVVGVGF